LASKVIRIPQREDSYGAIRLWLGGDELAVELNEVLSELSSGLT
jgi:hypothetical protein